MDKILVFIPCYNCEKQIVRVLAQFKDSKVSSFFDTVLVLDNGSKDSTLKNAIDSAKSMSGLKIIVGKNKDNYGLGGSHKTAFEYAKKHNFTHVVVLHGDDQGSIKDLVPVLERKDHHRLDCCLGGRFHPDSITPGYSTFRILGNHVFNALFTIVARTRIYDLGAGLNIYKTSMLADEFYVKYSDDLRFNCYMLLGTVRKNLTFNFFPITWREDDQVSNAKLFSQSINTLKIVIGALWDGRRYFAAEHRAVIHPEYVFDQVYPLNSAES